MFIGAAQLTQSKAPSDAGSVAIETAIKQQKEFEEALKLAQDRREVEAKAALDRAKAEAREKDSGSDRVTLSSEASLESLGSVEPGSDELISFGARGASVDVKV